MESTSADQLGEHFAAVVLELAPDGIAVTDESGRIVHANSRFEVLFGYTREQLAGHAVEMLLPERLRSAHRAHRADFAEAPITRPMGAGLTLWGCHADGTEFPVEIALSPVTTSSGMRTIMAVRQTEDRRAGDRASFEREVLADQDRIASALDADVVRPIFEASLALHGLIDTVDPALVDGVRAVVDQLDGAVRAIRAIVFDCEPSDEPATIDLRSIDTSTPVIER